MKLKQPPQVTSQPALSRALLRTANSYSSGTDRPTQITSGLGQIDLVADLVFLVAAEIAMAAAHDLKPGIGFAAECAAALALASSVAPRRKKRRPCSAASLAASWMKSVVALRSGIGVAVKARGEHRGLAVGMDDVGLGEE